MRVEVIVVDNASTDGAADMVAARVPARPPDPQRRPTSASPRANNQAAALARGRYLFFLNNDTVVPPGALRRLVDYAAAHPEVGLIGPRLRDGRGRIAGVVPAAGRRVAALLHRTGLLRWTGLFRRAYRRYRGRDGDFDDARGPSRC